MKKLLYIEWLKNYSYKPVRIFAIIYFIFIVFLLFLSQVDVNFGPFNINFQKQGFFDFPLVWNVVTFFGAMLKIFLGLIIIFTITHEFSNKMFKQNLIDGLSKKEYIFSKVGTITFLTLGSTILLSIIALILGLKYDVSASSMFNETYYLLGYFLKLFTFFSFLLFLSVLLRKSIFVLIIYILWFIVEIVLYSLNIKYAPKPADTTHMSVDDLFLITDYLPLNSMWQLINSIEMRAKTIQEFGGEFVFKIPYDNIVACTIYSALFIFGSYYILKKRDF